MKMKLTSDELHAKKRSLEEENWLKLGEDTQSVLADFAIC